MLRQCWDIILRYAFIGKWMKEDKYTSYRRGVIVSFFDFPLLDTKSLWQISCSSDLNCHIFPIDSCTESVTLLSCFRKWHCLAHLQNPICVQRMWLSLSRYHHNSYSVCWYHNINLFDYIIIWNSKLSWADWLLQLNKIELKWAVYSLNITLKL